MKTYIGVKMITAIAMSLIEFKESKGEDVTDLKNQDGYMVDYVDYQSWSPKDVFEAAYYPIEDKTRISQIDVDNFIVKREGIKLGDKTCIVLDTTLTGFDTIGTSAVVDPANYKQEIGEVIARKDITNAIWGHLGFVLQWAKNGLKANTNN